MKYLWIEDFDEKYGAERDILLKRWKSQFSLNEVPEEDIITKEHLLDALNSAENSNIDFDFILLDIRFPIHKNSSSDDVYNKFFETIYHREKFDKHQDKSTGILAYEYLTNIIHYPRERIAFVSANIEVKLIYPERINDALNEIKLDDMRYGIEAYLEDNDKEELCETVWKLNSKNEIIEWLNDNNIIEDNEDSSNIDSCRNYNEAFEELKSVGIKVLHAYSKTKDERINEDFKVNFLDKNTSTYIEIRRNLIEMSKLIQSNLASPRGEILDYDEDFLGFDISDVMKRGESKFINSYNCSYYYELLNIIKKLPLNLTEKDKNNTIKKTINEIVHSLEAFSRDGDYARMNLFLPLKMIRNASAHSLTNDCDYDEIYLAFVVKLAYRFYFKIEHTNKFKKSYEKYEDKISSIIQENTTFDNSKKFNSINDLQKYYDKNNKNISKQDVLDYYNHLKSL